MAQISFIHYNDILEAQRFDAEYFKPEYLEYEYKINELNYFQLGDRFITSLITDGDHGNPEYVEEGVDYIKVEQLSDIDLDLSEVHKVSTKCVQQQSSSNFVDKFDILLSMKGTLGKTTIVLNDYYAILNRDIAKIQIKQENINPFYVLMYLRSKYGYSFIEKFSSGAVQKGLYLNKIMKIKIPLLKKTLQQKIEKAVMLAYKDNTVSKELYQEAEQLLLSELKLIDCESGHKLTFETTSKKVFQSSRFDAEYFQPKYEEIVEHIENYYNGFNSVKNIIEFNNTNYKPDENKVYRYIALADISSQGYIESYEEKSGKELPSRARRKVKTNDVIISSIEGSLSSCAIVEEEHNDYLCSTGFYVMRSEVLTPEVLLVLFKTDIIQSLLKRGSNGTILAAITKAEIEQLTLPLIDEKVQAKISEKIKKSALLRKESKHLLELAKRSVEVAIEEGEEKALKLIEKEIKEYV